VTGKSYIDWFELPDIFVSVVGTCGAIHIVLHPKRFMILRRLIFLFACLLLLRSFTVIITSLPDASPECEKQHDAEHSYKDHPEDAIVKSFWRALALLSAPQDHITCGDMVFSGHTSFLSLCMLVFNQYCRGFKGSFIFRWIIYIIYITALIAIIGTKLHYTLDVALAILITTGLWKVYHAAITSEKIKQQYAILKWLEAEVVMSIDQDAFDGFYKKKEERYSAKKAKKKKDT